MTDTRPLKPKKPIWTRWWMIAIYAFVAIGIIGNLLGLGQPSTPASRPTSAASTPAASTEPTVPAARADCAALDVGVVDEINAGALGAAKAISGVWLPLDSADRFGGYTRIARVQLTADTGLNTPAIFLLDEGTDLILAGDPIAREYFNWGSAAEAGSPIAKWRDKVALGDLMSDLQRCATA